MDQKCSFVEQCPIVKYFGETGWMAVAHRYCYEGKFNECSRRRLRLAGKPVPDHLFPWDTLISNVPEQNEV